LDIRLSDHNDGYWVAQQMREAEPGGWTPIIFLSGLDSDLDVWRGIEAGGDDYLVKPVKPIVLVAKLRAMRRLLDMRRRLVTMSEELHLANQRLNEMVEVDPLTGLVNRRGFDRILHSEILAARRDGLPLTLMLCDLDHFKRFNDTVGHVQGDACLREVGRILKEVCVRPRDAAARYGGEEFLLIFPATPLLPSLNSCERIRALVEAHPWQEPLRGRVTVSIGVTQYVLGESVLEFFSRADTAVYLAKQGGRNQVVVQEPVGAFAPAEDGEPQVPAHGYF
ncbi:diguanylate cyclase, partial [Rhizobium sp. 18055]|uniref:GGDEF domain-containing response regulator n=1 Tax=Rhizobium sp. 18055 TaxID=2681403 RepID=UPI0013580D28